MKTEGAIQIKELLQSLDKRNKERFSEEELAEFKACKDPSWNGELDVVKNKYDETYSVLLLSNLFGNELDYYRPFVGKRFTRVKRLIRKAGKCVLIPLVETQMVINSSSKELFRQQRLRMDELEQEVADLKEQIRVLQERD